MAEQLELRTLSPDDHEQLRLLYQVSAQDIAFFKNQQWSATNYALLIQVALVYIAHQVLKRPAVWEMVFLIVAAWAATLAGLLVISRLRNSIVARRQRLDNIRPHFGDAFKRAWDVKKEADDIHWLLQGAALLGAIVVTWLVVYIGLGRAV